ncbi:MAG TPA: hypothetical protein VKD28_12035 [Gemmatimonadales bacterium]|nr:hypothetical protein [Gemmatimonadales bacterium]
MKSNYLSLDAREIVNTIDRLRARIEDRFSGSGLGQVCAQLLQISRDAGERAAQIAKPILPLRIATGILAVVIVAGLILMVTRLRPPPGTFELGQFIQVLEAGINDVVLIGAAIFFLITIEARIKRRRALRALRELRSIAHIIDMHQLTKDPERTDPDRPMTARELGRYLDYCSEMLSLTGKVAALYVQDFEDDVALQAVNEIEDLTTGLARKIWQKLSIVTTDA